jgi:hypothetical protein
VKKMPESFTYRAENGRCSDCVVDAREQLTGLWEETKTQSEILQRVDLTVFKMSEKLIGSIDNPRGFLVKVESEIVDLKAEIKLIKEWKETVDKLTRAVVFKIIGSGFIAIVAGAVVAITIIKLFGLGE